MWPLSMAHLLNTKLTPATAGWRTAPIAGFAARTDVVLESTQARRVYSGRKRIALRRSRPWGGPSLWSVMRERRSVRSFARRAIPQKVLARLLEEPAGVTGQTALAGTAGVVQRLRAWPSAGALYPIELYAIVQDEAVYHYDPIEPALEVLVEGPMRERVAPHVLTVDRELDAPVLLALSVVPERTLAKYGERGYRFLWLDAGHLAQNVLLAATALGLGACPIGGFHEDEIARAMGIDARETLVYLIALGYPGRR